MRKSLVIALACAIKASLATVKLSKNGDVTIGDQLYRSKDIISRDVAILGGGSTGTYSAVRLSQDFGKSVVVVEKNGIFVSQSSQSTC